MNQELEQYFNTYFELFRSKGFKQLLGELKANAGQINSVENVKDADDLHFKKGQLSMLATILNLETSITTAHAQAQMESEDPED